MCVRARGVWRAPERCDNSGQPEVSNFQYTIRREQQIGCRWVEKSSKRNHGGSSTFHNGGHDMQITHRHQQAWLEVTMHYGMAVAVGDSLKELKHQRLHSSFRKRAIGTESVHEG